MRVTSTTLLLCAFALAASSARGETSYRHRGDVLTRYIHEKMWDDRARTYLDRHPRPEKGLPYCTMWGLGIQFSALASGVRYDPAHYRPLMDRFFDGLEQYYNRSQKMYSAYLGGTMDLYYDDNHWMILDYLEAYEITKSPRYLAKAREILDGCLGGVDGVLGGGSYWHYNRVKYPTKNTCSNAPLATALLRMSGLVRDPAKKRELLRRGREILAWTTDTLQDTDGIMWDNINTKTREINKRWTFTYNTALIIRAHLELYRQTRSRASLEEAKRLARAAAKWLRRDGAAEDARHYHDPVQFTVHLIEALLEVYEITRDEALLMRCRRTAEYYWRTWRQGRPAKLMDLASVARMQWLLGAHDRPGARRGRTKYVRVELDGAKKTITLAEVEVMVGRTNVACRGRALQSSTYEECYAERAVDGTTSGGWGDSSMAHTEVDRRDPWWEVALDTKPGNERIDAIRVWNRTDAVQDRITGARVLVLDDERRPVWQAAIDETPRPSVEFAVGSR